MVSYFLIIPIIEKNNKVKLYSMALVGYVGFYILFSFLKNIYVIVGLGILLSVMVTLRVTCFGILIREKSEKNKVSENEGLIYTAGNISWLVGPLIAGFIASRYSEPRVFLFAVGMLIIALILLRAFRIKSNNPPRKKIDNNVLKILKEFFGSKKRRLSYILGGGVNFWWALIYVYMPMYIIDKGLGDITLGIFLAAIVVPLVLLEYYFSKMASKKGFRKMFFLGYFIIAVLSFACFFITNSYAILGFLILASIGAAMIEPTTEAYFFDIVSERQREKFYGPYNTAIDVGHFSATMISAVILLVLPFKFVFVFFGVGTLFLALLSLKIKNIIEERRK